MGTIRTLGRAQTGSTRRLSRAFALPTVLIASVVLLSILAVSVTATATVRETLKSQYYAQLAQVAGEAGVAMAKACLAANGNVPTWTDDKPLTPATDCSGSLILAPTVKALVVGGGGAGGSNHGGGGGAGGVIYNDSFTVSQQSYSITVGAGAPANTVSGNAGGNGGNSVFDTLIANGGGGGGARVNTGSVSQALSGGSGGGGAGTMDGSTGHAGYGAVGATGLGNAGGNGSSDATAGNGGGGGGAGGAGANATGGGSGAGTSGAGGVGIPSSISGSSIYYAGGGSGGRWGGGSSATGGVGGGGNGGTADGVAGTAGQANTGGGGGGSGGGAAGGGAGGSGVVVISYPINSGITSTASVTPTTSGGNRIYRFTGNGTFAVTSTGSTSCPTSPACSVAVNGNIRSSFSIPKPAVDSQGRAVTIANNGYVEITRSSNGAVWRTYRQPNVQLAVVPDLCSGNATANRGWTGAVKTSQQYALNAASSAQTIALDDGPLNAGIMYFRRDFNASFTGSYDLNVYTGDPQDIAATYIDGQPIATSQGSLATSQLSLTAGCHSIVVKLTNDTYMPRASRFAAAITRSGAASPVVVSDTNWRVTAGDAMHFSIADYFEAPTAWESVQDLGVWNNTAVANAPTDWSTTSGDKLTEFITTPFNSGGNNRPNNQYAWFRNPLPFTTTTATTVRVSTYCDDQCDLYLDGNLVMAAGALVTGNSKSISLQPGTHTFGIRLYNSGSGPNPASLLFAAVDLATNQVLDRSGPNWNATTSWSSSASNLFSYDATYIPTPAVQASLNAKVLVVGGGGGGGSNVGGGGGGGGVVSNIAYPISTGTYTVTVGGGGAGSPPAGAPKPRGSNGGTSSFGTLRAIGGGGGATDYSTNNSPPGAGASAGGSAGCTQTFQAGFTIGLGNGSAATAGCRYPTGGGGAGGSGATNPGTGGVGMVNNILGTAYFFGGGGGGSGYTGNGGNGGNGGGGGGAIGSTSGGAGLNPGAAGGGGSTATDARKPGGNGGANTGGGGGGGSAISINNAGGNGGSGIVVISFPVGRLSVSTTGTVNDYSSSTPGFTTLAFLSSGSFTVTSLN